MAVNQELNLIGVISPFCLLEFKSALARIRPMQILEVLIQDPEVAEDLVRIVDRSEDLLIAREAVGDHFCLRVQRAGARPETVEEET